MAPAWGDGFADDGVAAARAVTDWAACSPDEYAMLFPRLLPTDGTLAPALRRHVEDGVAARARRLLRLDPTAPVPGLRSRVPGAEAAGPHRAWFADDGAVHRSLRRMGLLRTSAERIAAERRLLALLDGVLDAVQRGSAPAWSEDREAWFAFGSGVHPAYLWPESASSPARGLAAAWLGHLDRGRTALMPAAVADYLLDAVLDPSRARDRALGDMVGSPEHARRLRRAAASKLAGRDPVVAPGRRSLFAFPDFAAVPREDVLEHA